MKKKLPLITLIIGLVVLAAGGTFCAIKFLSGPKTPDADFLVQVGAWVEEGSDNSVIWTFSEVGKGTLTTNSHLNDYSFIWALDGDTFKVETAWLYELNNEYKYTLDQSNKKLVLTDANSKTYTFVPSTASAPADIKTTK